MSKTNWNKISKNKEVIKLLKKKKKLEEKIRTLERKIEKSK